MSQLGSSLYTEFVVKQELNVLELLSLFPSCCPPATVFLAVVAPMAPRYYSAASSPLVVGKEYVQFAFTVVDYWSTECGVQRKGLCTNWLEGLCKSVSIITIICYCIHELWKYFFRIYIGGVVSFLHTTNICTYTTFVVFSSSGNKEKIPIFLRPTKEFFLPGSPRWPCILIAPGTGVSPFIGFLQHRKV